MWMLVRGGDSNPHAMLASGPKPGASTNFATRADVRKGQRAADALWTWGLGIWLNRSHFTGPRCRDRQRWPRIGPAGDTCGLMENRARERRSLRKLSGRLAALPAGACGRRSPPSTGSPAPPTTSPTKATRRRDERLADLAAYRADLHADRGRRARRRRAGPTSSARSAARSTRIACRCRCSTTCSSAFEQDVRKTATPTAPSCSTTAAARPTRSAGCCCTCTASTTRASLRAVRRDLHRAAAHQLLAGPRRRRRARPPLRAARPTAQRHGVDPTRCSPRARQRPRSRALVARAGRLGARADARRRAARRTRVAGRAGWELRLVVQGGLRILEKIERIGYATLTQRPALGWRDVPLLAWRALTMRRGRSTVATAARRRRSHDARAVRAGQGRRAAARASTTPSCSCRRRGAPRSPPSTPSAARSTTSSTRSRDPGVAATKLAWWRSEVAAAFAGKPSHPVMKALMPHTAALRHRAARTCSP